MKSVPEGDFTYGQGVKSRSDVRWGFHVHMQFSVNPPPRPTFYNYNMTDPIDRLCRDAIRKCDTMSVSWTNGELTGHLDSVDRDFVMDVANAFARMCDRRERERERNGKI